jgi:class 3 adenylate cyclase/pimeloyl-ACP methyl ester carboxylesterase
MEPQMRFCTSLDGTRIAYAAIGEGPPLVCVPPWGGSLERDWNHPQRSAGIQSLSESRRFVSHDRRGVGGSQRHAHDFSLEAQVADLSAVVEELHLGRFDLWGVLDGAAISVAYAVQNPQCLRRLVLWSAYGCGVEIVRPGAGRGLIELIRGNWSLARRAIADTTFPSGSTELRRWLADSLRQIVDPEIAAKLIEFYATVDVRHLLPRMDVPTLVLHRRGSRNAPISAGRDVAALIPNARFVALEGDADSPWEGDISYLDMMTQFLDEGHAVRPAAEGAPPVGLATILFTDIEASTALTQRLGDAGARDVLRTHERIVRNALRAHGGSEVKTMGDGFMASFASATKALECAISTQRAFAEHNESAQEPIRVRIGLNAGEPIAEDQDLFGTAVIRAARIAAIAQGGEILVANVVRELAEGKGFMFSDRGPVALRGFDDPVKVFEVRWQD